MSDMYEDELKKQFMRAIKPAQTETIKLTSCPVEFAKDDSGKHQLSLLPIGGLYGVSRVMEHGAKKYGRFNWRNSAAASRYIDACLRHIFAYLEGETFDPESGLSHIDHAAANMLMLSASNACGTVVDDRHHTSEYNACEQGRV